MDPGFPSAISRAFGGRLKTPCFPITWVSLFLTSLRTVHLISQQNLWELPVHVWTHLVPCTISYKDTVAHRPMLLFLIRTTLGFPFYQSMIYSSVNPWFIPQFSRDFQIWDGFWGRIWQYLPPARMLQKSWFIGAYQLACVKEVVPDLLVLTLSWICAIKHSGKGKEFFVSSCSNS